MGCRKPTKGKAIVKFPKYSKTPEYCSIGASEEYDLKFDASVFENSDEEEEVEEEVEMEELAPKVAPKVKENSPRVNVVAKPVAKNNEEESYKIQMLNLKIKNLQV